MWQLCLLKEPPHGRGVVTMVMGRGRGGRYDGRWPVVIHVAVWQRYTPLGHSMGNNKKWGLPWHNDIVVSSCTDHIWTEPPPRLCPTLPQQPGLVSITRVGAVGWGPPLTPPDPRVNQPSPDLPHASSGPIRCDNPTPPPHRLPPLWCQTDAAGPSPNSTYIILRYATNPTACLPMSVTFSENFFALGYKVARIHWSTWHDQCTLLRCQGFP